MNSFVRRRIHNFFFQKAAYSHFKSSKWDFFFFFLSMQTRALYSFQKAQISDTEEYNLNSYWRKESKIPRVLLSYLSHSILCYFILPLYFSISLLFMQISALHYSYLLREARHHGLILVSPKRPTLYCIATVRMKEEREYVCVHMIPPLLSVFPLCRL